MPGQVTAGTRLKCRCQPLWIAWAADEPGSAHYDALTQRAHVGGDDREPEAVAQGEDPALGNFRVWQHQDIRRLEVHLRLSIRDIFDPLEYPLSPDIGPERLPNFVHIVLAPGVRLARDDQPISCIV